MSKTCARCCLSKPLCEYNKRARSKDGHNSSCRKCCKERRNTPEVKAAEAASRSKYLKTSAGIKSQSIYRNSEKGKRTKAAYAATEERRIKKAEYSITSGGKSVRAKALLKSKEKYPERYAARNAVKNAIDRGELAKLPCWVCGETEVQGHHSDYDSPLEVVWLCKKHHDEIHLETQPSQEVQNAV